jgi:hypothetical protein
MNILHLVAREGEAAALLCQAMIAMMSAMLSYLFNFLMEDHPVGRWYLCQLQRLPEVMAKPLGECPYCSAPWQYLAINFLFIYDTDWFLCFLGLGLNFATIRFLIPPVK